MRQADREALGLRCLRYVSLFSRTTLNSFLRYLFSRYYDEAYDFASTSRTVGKHVSGPASLSSSTSP